MLRSMTGYGRAQLEDASFKVTVELKSVNHRFLEMVIRLPKKYSLLEDKIKGAIRKRISRGRVEAWVGIEEMDKAGLNVNVDKDLAMDYYNSLKELAHLLGISPQITLYELCKLEGIITLKEPETDLERIWEITSKPLEEALEQLVLMRENEGSVLKADLESRSKTILDLIGQIERRNPEVVQAYKNRLSQKIKELTDNLIEIDENRLATEVAIFAEKTDITEEIIRLKSHIEQLAESIEEQENPVGRKLDFILQEMYREINTISSKSADVMISYMVVEVKSEIEKMREQIQNVE